MLSNIPLEDFRKLQDEDDRAPLNHLVRKIKLLAPMARCKDRDEEAKVRLLRSAVVGTSWDLKVASAFFDYKSYQELTNAISISQQHISKNDAAGVKHGTKARIGIRKTELGPSSSQTGTPARYAIYWTGHIFTDRLIEEKTREMIIARNLCRNVSTVENKAALLVTVAYQNIRTEFPRRCKNGVESVDINREVGGSTSRSYKTRIAN